MSPASWTMKLLVMSRGLGKLQRRILEHLETAGRWQSAQQVITALTDSSESEPSPSFQVSVRRAAQGLRRRRLIEVGSVSLRYHEQTAYWLPDHEPPQFTNHRVWHSWLACELVTRLLSQMTDEEARESFIYDSRPWAKTHVPQSGEVTYRHLVGEFLKRFSSDGEDPAARTAILRAVRRLAKEGKLELLYYECDPITIGTVRQVS